MKVEIIARVHVSQSPYPYYISSPSCSDIYEACTSLVSSLLVIVDGVIFVWDRFDMNQFYLRRIAFEENGKKYVRVDDDNVFDIASVKGVSIKMRKVMEPVYLAYKLTGVVDRKAVMSVIQDLPKISKRGDNIKEGDEHV
jgi:hypothetical protein